MSGRGEPSGARSHHEGVILPESGGGKGEERERERSGGEHRRVGRASRRGRRPAGLLAGMPAQEHLRRRGLQAGRAGRRAPRHDLPRGEGVLLEASHLARARARAGSPGAGARGPRQPRLHVETAVRVAQARPVAPRARRRSHRRRGPREGPHVRSRGGRRPRSRRVRGALAAAARAQPAHLVAGRVDARRRAGERRGMQTRALRAHRVPST